MKTTGILRGFDKNGRFVLPAEMIKTLGLTQSDMLEISCDGTKITLRKHYPFCLLCGDIEELVNFKHKKICKKCYTDIADGMLD